MLVKLMKSKIHRAVVTRSDLHYEGSIGIDENLLRASGILPFESVHVWNVNNGQRLQTYAIPAPSGSGEVFLNGAAAQLGQAGDLVIIATFCWLLDEAARQHHPRIVLVDTANRLSSTY